METPPSGMPSPPLSPHGTPSSLSSEFPSLEGSIYSVLAPDSPCHYTYSAGGGGGFTSHDVHHDAMQHLILPSLTLQQQQSRAISRTASVSGFADYGRQAGIGITLQQPVQSSSARPLASSIELPDNVRLLVIGRHGAGKTFLCENLVQGSVEGFTWTYEAGVGKVLSQTKTLIEEKKKTGLKIVRLDGWDESSDEPSQVLDSILSTIHQPFRDLDQVLHPTTSVNASLNTLSIDLLTSTAAPLYTAAIVVLSPHPTPTETSLLQPLSQHIPVIPFSPHQPRRRRHHSPDALHLAPDSRAHSRHRPSSRISHYGSSRAPSRTRLTPISEPNFTFHPTSHRALTEWLFDEINLRALRREAAEKFLRWRERERCVERYASNLPPSPPEHNDDTTTPPNVAPPSNPAQSILPLDAFERFTFDQMFTPSDIESADFADDSEVDRQTTDDGESDAEERLALTRGQFLPDETANETHRSRAWETELSRLVALRKRGMQLERMDTVRPGMHFQSNHSLRRPLSEMVPSQVDADNMLLFQPSPRPVVQHRQEDTTDYESLEQGYQTASSDIGTFPTITTTTRTTTTTSTASTPSEQPSTDYATLDPLHLPSLLSLALSILPEIKTRIIAKIKFWILPAAFTLPRHSDDLLDEKVGLGGMREVWDEKRGLVMVQSDDETVRELQRGATGAGPGANGVMLSLPAVGAIAVAAAALGFWAGVTVNGRAGLLTLRAM